MGDKSNIEWTEATWNVLSGCSRVSPECTNCYAERLSATRLASTPKYAGVAEMVAGRDPRWTGVVRFHEEVLDQPLRWQRPRLIFPNSMSDTFHELVDELAIARMFAVMLLAPRHRFQVLTKRSRRMRELLSSREFWEAVHYDAARRLTSGPRSHAPKCFEMKRGEEFVDEMLVRGIPNVWIGVSTGNQESYYFRIDDLLRTPAYIRWLSCEPLLSGIELGLEDACGPDDCYLRSERLHWIVAGGESGPGARPPHPDWVRGIRDQAVAAGVSFFFKQWGEWAPHGEVEFDYAEWEKLYESGRRTHVSSTNGSTGDMQMPYTWEVLRVGKKRAGRELDGRTWEQMPV